MAVLSRPVSDVFGTATSGWTPTGIHIHRILSGDQDTASYLWLPTSNRAGFQDVEWNVDSITTVDWIDTVEDESVARIQWGERNSGFFRAIQETGARFLGAYAADDSIQFTLQFESQVDLIAFHRDCQDMDVPIEIEAVYHADDRYGEDVATTLTEAQAETLAFALQEGYYDVPRRINLSEIAEEYGVSDTAISQRLRRGLKKILSDVLQEEETDGGEANFLDIGEETN